MEFEPKTHKITMTWEMGSITSANENHDNLQIYLSLKDQIMSNYFSLHHFKRRVIYADNIRNNYFINFYLHLKISEFYFRLFYLILQNQSAADNVIQ